MGINVEKEEKNRRLMAVKDDKLMESTREPSLKVIRMYTHISIDIIYDRRLSI